MSQRDQTLSIKRQAIGVFSKEKKSKHEGQKQLLQVTISSNVSSYGASFLVANQVGKDKKPFTLSKGLILLAAKKFCNTLLEEAAVLKGGTHSSFC